ncbi:unnamed protein product [Cylindrotheca closterium]|uniref:Uncharacterized protein n=1 Tax=Cylindrotheca closterium TaxID=2856 RepID=A0AAD2FY24_9STRA|nr:unnamed protein product [Cylindrotheca closterium]
MSSDNSTEPDGSKKRAAEEVSDDSDQRSRKTSKAAVGISINQETIRTGSDPPADDKRLGNYITNDDEWFNEGVTSGKKKSSKSQSIEALKEDEDYFIVTQKYLKIDLAHFLKTGETKPFISSTAATASQRVASIDFDIIASKMVYKRDLMALIAAVKKLFEWKVHQSKEYMAPYFPLIQSSGAGKTKLLHESQCSMANDTDVHVRLILCTNGDPPEMLSQNCSIFSETLDVSQFQVGEDGQRKLSEKMATLVETNDNKKKVVLLFDESQHLTSNSDGWHFRCIRWWLRLPDKPNGVNVVCVFAGTTTRLANYYAEQNHSTDSRNASVKYLGGKKLYPPFCQLTTTGLVSRSDGPKFGTVGVRTNGNIVTEFDVATQYGRPLFGRLQLNGKLKDALGSILFRMRGAGQELSLQKYFSLLATRLQMGQVSFDFASELVASGYAHLTHFSPPVVAEIAFLPDPVCAWLAMTQMIKDCDLYEKVGGILMGCGKHPSVWSEKAIKIYSSALCRPEKGDVGEVAAAFYMLACGDELRFEHSRDLTQLSVPLENWIARMQQGKGAKLSKSTAKPSVNFIQVCRNYLHYTLNEIQDSGLLKHWYLGGRASYAYASCKAYDMLVPLQYTVNGTLHYCPMLVSVKNRVAYSAKQRQAAIEAMEKVFTDAKVETGVCMLFHIGLGDTLEESSSLSHTFCQGKVVSVTIVLPTEDEFGATNLALCSTCGGGQESEVMVSHAELAFGAEGNCLLRSKTKNDDLSKSLLNDISKGYNEAFGTNSGATTGTEADSTM